MLGFLKRNLRVNSSTLKAKACKGLVRPLVDYCSNVWDPRPDVENNGSCKIERIQRRAARWCLRRYNNSSSVTNMLEDLGWRSQTSLRSPGGSSLLTLTGYCALSCAGHVARSRKVSSRFKLACPLSIYPFFQDQLVSGTKCLLLSLVNTAL